MTSLLQTIIIFPIVQIIELCYLFAYRVINNHGIALIGVSVAVSVFTLPLYMVAEKHQQNERLTQRRLKPKIDKIKSVFKSDEQYLVLSAFYKQNHYHPVFAMRNTFSLLIQIPFFIAAYSYLSHLDILSQASFLLIRDLSLADGLFPLGKYRINVLPVLMTLINIISGAVYTKDLPARDKIQVYGIALIFLAFLYNSPSGLVLYWTMNNIFSLVKNILQGSQYSKKIIFFSLIVIVTFFDIYLLCFHPGDLPNRLLATLLISSVILIPLAVKLLVGLTKPITVPDLNQTVPLSPLLFILPCIILFLLHGCVIPSSLISSSVEEFSFIGQRTTPFPFILATSIQSAGIFLFWPLVIFFLFSAKIRRILTYLFTLLSGSALINVFFIRENFGFLTPTMVLSEPKPFSLIPGTYIVNIAIIFAVVAVLLVLLIHKKGKVILSFQIITAVALAGLLVYNVHQIKNDFAVIVNRHGQQSAENENFTTQYTFSQKGKNVLLILLDCAVGYYLPYILEEKPELTDMMEGFHWYPNCVSYANHTLIAALPIYGGYEYTPAAINSRDDTLLLDKQKEAYLLLPELFNKAGYAVTVTDPPFDNFQMSNIAIFDDNPDIKAENLLGIYTKPWLNNHRDITSIDISALLDNYLIRFSFFKSAPLALRLFIYDRARWLTLNTETSDQLSEGVINDYAFLDALDKITGFSETGNTYTSVYAHLPHGMAFFQAPDYIPVQNVTDKGFGKLSGDGRFHTITASLLLLGRWFDYLKANDAYDNTRIILVADHGRGSAGVPENISLPDGSSRLQSYNPLLMVKDFDSRGAIIKSEDFMTNGDVPLLALEGIIDNPENPFTKKPLKPDKGEGIAVTTIGVVSTYRHNKFTYNIADNQWLHVKDDVFIKSNWERPKE